MGRSALKSVMKLIDIANEQIPIEGQFLKDLQTSIEKISQNNSKKPSQTYKPSGMNCTRSMVYQVLGKDIDSDKPSYQSVGIAESGTDRHVRIQKAIESIKDTLNIDCEFVNVEEFVKLRHLDYLEIKGQSGMECKLYHKGLNMSFMCDGIIQYKGRYYIFEFKTEVANKFYDRTDVDDSHKNQATAYALAFGIDEVLFVYENRNTLDKKAFLYKVSAQNKLDLVNTLKYCQQYVEENKIPPKPYNVAKKTCNYCPYKRQCKEDGNGD